jgi:hypothetical protein
MGRLCGRIFFVRWHAAGSTVLKPSRRRPRCEKRRLSSRQARIVDRPVKSLGARHLVSVVDETEDTAKGDIHEAREQYEIFRPPAVVQKSRTQSVGGLDRLDDLPPLW